MMKNKNILCLFITLIVLTTACNTHSDKSESTKFNTDNQPKLFDDIATKLDECITNNPNWRNNEYSQCVLIDEMLDSLKNYREYTLEENDSTLSFIEGIPCYFSGFGNAKNINSYRDSITVTMQLVYQERTDYIFSTEVSFKVSKEQALLLKKGQYYEMLSGNIKWFHSGGVLNDGYREDIEYRNNADSHQNWNINLGKLTLQNVTFKPLS